MYLKIANLEVAGCMFLSRPFDLDLETYLMSRLFDLETWIPELPTFELHIRPWFRWGQVSVHI